jgi:thioredoxin reductase (NADPH)
MDFELAIIGSGPGGLSAGVYAARSGVNAMIFEAGMPGGTININPLIENYLGFKSIQGADLALKMKEHAEKYVEIKTGEGVDKLEVVEDRVKLTTYAGSYEAGAVILATGTEYRRLGVKGENTFTGKGVSYCATCDGMFFKNKPIAIVGGGSTAAVEALYLANLTDKISLIHRRDKLRAEEIYVEQLKEKGVNLMLNSVVEEIYGEDVVNGLKIKNVETGEITDVPLNGVFVSIGESPKTELAKQIGVELDDHGYIKTDKQMRTNIKRVYAVGDVTGGVRQIVTAAAEGAIAALTSLEVLGKQYPY